RWMPINVKVRGEGRTWPVLEQIHPPWVLTVGSHVVGHYVKQQAHPVLLHFLNKGVKLFVRPKFRIQMRRVRHVVAVRTPTLCLQKGGRIDVGDAKVVKIRNQCPGVVETKLLIELQAIRRDRGTYS